jgi:hypothetical protein
MPGHRRSQSDPLAPHPRIAQPKVPAKRQRQPRISLPLRRAAVMLAHKGQPLDWLEAIAKDVGITTHALRTAFVRPDFQRLLDRERRTALELEIGPNIEALRRIRDTSENAMGVVGAVKTLEQLRQEARDPVRGANTGTVSRPGLIVQIINQAPPAAETPTIEISEIQPASESEGELLEDCDFGAVRAVSRAIE